jgi:hypothetical protein
MVTKALELVVVDIQVDRNGNVKVTRDPDVPKLVSGQHQVRFTSNKPQTVIVYTDTSPFADADLPDGKKLPLGRSGEGPFKVIKAGHPNHFDCGEIDAAGSFTKWGGGGNTPT